jgi:NAD(P)-dependent dehydrogenase (short-subunit alcohol dehydrogenase family)
MARLQDKRCVVTGGASGIGLGICEAFAREGASVLLTDIDEAAGKAAAAKIGCDFAVLDVRLEAQWADLEAAEPAIDVLVNNAGIARPARSGERLACRVARGARGQYRRHLPRLSLCDPGDEGSR